MKHLFKFKQFEVDQRSCAMKINTDGVLLGAMVQADEPKAVLDIGTGTGVIALMLAQRFPLANVTAVEIDKEASNTAKRNFQASRFSQRMSVVHTSIENFSEHEKFDLIVSNPPFFVNDLKNLEEKKGIARHTNAQFFNDLLNKVQSILKKDGRFWIILPVKQAEQLIADAQLKGFYWKAQICIHSDENKPAFRWIVCLTVLPTELKKARFNIYKSEKVYTDAYFELLKDFFLGY